MIGYGWGSIQSLLPTPVLFSMENVKPALEPHVRLRLEDAGDLLRSGPATEEKTSQYHSNPFT